MFYNVLPPLPENRVVCEIMWKKYCRAGLARDDNMIRRMRIALQTAKAKQTHSEYLIRMAVPHQQRLDKFTSLLRYTFIGCRQAQTRNGSPQCVMVPNVVDFGSCKFANSCTSFV
jgi:hypothetical protein